MASISRTPLTINTNLCNLNTENREPESPPSPYLDSPGTPIEFVVTPINKSPSKNFTFTSQITATTPLTPRQERLLKSSQTLLLKQTIKANDENTYLPIEPPTISRRSPLTSASTASSSSSSSKESFRAPVKISQTAASSFTMSFGEEFEMTINNTQEDKERLVSIIEGNPRWLTREDPEGNTIFLQAAAKGSSFMMNLLLTNFSQDTAFLNAKNKKGQTALHIVCEKSDFTAVYLLLKHKASVNVLDADLQTPCDYLERQLSSTRGRVDACLDHMRTLSGKFSRELVAEPTINLKSPLSGSIPWNKSEQ